MKRFSLFCLASMFLLFGAFGISQAQEAQRIIPETRCYSAEFSPVPCRNAGSVDCQGGVCIATQLLDPTSQNPEYKRNRSPKTVPRKKPLNPSKPTESLNPSKPTDVRPSIEPRSEVPPPSRALLPIPVGQPIGEQKTQPLEKPAITLPPPEPILAITPVAEDAPVNEEALTGSSSLKPFLEDNNRARTIVVQQAVAGDSSKRRPFVAVPHDTNEEITHTHRILHPRPAPLAPQQNPVTDPQENNTTAFSALMDDLENAQGARQTKERSKSPNDSGLSEDDENHSDDPALVQEAITQLIDEVLDGLQDQYQTQTPAFEENSALPDDERAYLQSDERKNAYVMEYIKLLNDAVKNNYDTELSLDTQYDLFHEGRGRLGLPIPEDRTSLSWKVGRAIFETRMTAPEMPSDSASESGDDESTSDDSALGDNWDESEDEHDPTLEREREIAGFLSKFQNIRYNDFVLHRMDSGLYRELLSDGELDPYLERNDVKEYLKSKETKDWLLKTEINQLDDNLRNTYGNQFTLSPEEQNTLLQEGTLRLDSALNTQNTAEYSSTEENNEAETQAEEDTSESTPPPTGQPQESEADPSNAPTTNNSPPSNGKTEDGHSDFLNEIRRTGTTKLRPTEGKTGTQTPAEHVKQITEKISAVKKDIRTVSREIATVNRRVNRGKQLPEDAEATLKQKQSALQHTKETLEANLNAHKDELKEAKVRQNAEKSDLAVQLGIRRMDISESEESDSDEAENFDDKSASPFSPPVEPDKEDGDHEEATENDVSSYSSHTEEDSSPSPREDQNSNSPQAQPAEPTDTTEEKVLVFDRPDGSSSDDFTTTEVLLTPGPDGMLHTDGLNAGSTPETPVVLTERAENVTPASTTQDDVVSPPAQNSTETEKTGTPEEQTLTTEENTVESTVTEESGFEEPNPDGTKPSSDGISFPGTAGSGEGDDAANEKDVLSTTQESASEITNDAVEVTSNSFNDVVDSGVIANVNPTGTDVISPTGSSQDSSTSTSGTTVETTSSPPASEPTATVSDPTPVDTAATVVMAEINAEPLVVAPAS